jgi:hypothetical protein
MWQYFIYALVFLLGWYLYPFDNRVRSAINALVMKLVSAIVEMIQSKQGTPKNRTTHTASPQTARISPQQGNPRPYGKICTACKEGMLEPIKEGTYKGFWFCPRCKTMEATK